MAAITNARRANTYTDSSNDQRRMRERPESLSNSDRKYGNEGDCHGCTEPLDTIARTGDSMPRNQAPRTGSRRKDQRRRGDT
jgi:hypothetical protein